MKFGVSTFLWESPFDTRSFDLVHKIKNMGFDIVEIPVENKSLLTGQNWWEKKIEFLLGLPKSTLFCKLWPVLVRLANVYALVCRPLTLIISPI